MESGLAGRRILVTGAAGGIGQEICRYLAREGAVPLIHYRSSREAARSLAGELSAELDREVPSVSADLTDEGSVDGMFAQLNESGPVDDLVVNAAIYNASGPVHRMTLADWRHTIDSNLTSAFLTCRGYLRDVATRRPPEAAIVLVSSTAAQFGEADNADYAASKAALHGLCLTLKNEIVRLTPGGRVNTVRPGWVRTEMAAEALAVPNAIDRITRTMALRKVATPEDVASTVTYLLSPTLAGHVTGSFLTVAGGMEGRILHDSDL
jgi:3-oxoacyl-[acyl-carrier protein] reductase